MVISQCYYLHIYIVDSNSITFVLSQLSVSQSIETGFFGQWKSAFELSTFSTNFFRKLFFQLGFLQHLQHSTCDSMCNWPLGPAHFSQHRPRFRPAPYSPPKKKTLFSFGSHFRSFCVVHFTFHSVHSECVSHPLVRVLRGYFAKLLRHYFPCVSVCVFFFYSFFLLLEKYIYVYIFFFCLDYALLALFEIISLPPGGRLVIHVVWLQCVCTRLAMQW